MPTLNENTNRPGAHILHEASSQYSREKVTVTAGNYKAGTVMAKVTATGKYKQLAPAAADGTQTATVIMFAGVDASALDKEATVNDIATIVRDSSLIWPSGITGPQKLAAIASLRAQGIKVR